MESKELVFRNLNVSLKQKHVLKNISGVAKSKEVLGIFGPKGIVLHVSFHNFYPEFVFPVKRFLV